MALSRIICVRSELRLAVDVGELRLVRAVELLDLVIELLRNFTGSIAWVELHQRELPEQCGALNGETLVLELLFEVEQASFW
jgi:hypothetical protein